MPEPADRRARNSPSDATGESPSGEAQLPTADELEALEAALAESPALRALAQRAVDWLQGALSRREEPEEDPQESTLLIPEPEPVATRVRSLRLGGSEVPVEVPDTGEEPAQPTSEAAAHAAPIAEDGGSLRIEPDLGLVERRARLKAECCRWAVLRRRRLQAGADFDQAIRPVDRELAGRARALQECRAWPLDPYAALPESDAALEDVAGCYESLAQACELMRDVRGDERTAERFAEEAYQLFAESQSALRIGLSELVDIDYDRDQKDAFDWLRLRTTRDEIYVPRFMRLSDPADPTNWHDLQARLDDLSGRQESVGQEWRRKKSLFNRLRFHGRRIEQARAHEPHVEDWDRIDFTLGELVDGGLPPSNVELRELLVPWIDRLPDDYVPGAAFGRVLREVDRFLASRETETRDAPPTPPTPEVLRAADLLRGRRVVLIGGHERPKSRAALERAFELSELRWITTSSGRSYTTFEPEIARPETALVILAIRWCSHSFENAKSLCERHKKPFVRLPAGYSPNRVALEVLNQASEQLT